MKTIFNKFTIAAALSAVIFANAEITTRKLKVSEFLMSPTTAWVKGAASANSKVPVTEELSTSGDVGFRVIHLRASTHATKLAALDLASTKMLKVGDIFLTFRPEWDGTLAYAHMQLGISHTGLVFFSSDSSGTYIHTLESPIGYSSPMNYAEHYGDVDAIHVIRPNLTDAQRANLAKWAKRALAHPERLGFYKDYGKPFYKREIAGVTEPVDQIKHLAKVILGTVEDGGHKTFESYCSEWAWTFLGLRDCNPDAYKDGCAKPIFDTQNGALTGIIPKLVGDAGLIQGPEATLKARNAAERTEILTTKVFKDTLSSPDELAGRMSSGHRAVAETFAGLMKTVNEKYYFGGAESPQVAEAINSQVVRNFSPTSFMIRSNAGLDGFQYVGTVVWDR